MFRIKRTWHYFASRSQSPPTSPKSALPVARIDPIVVPERTVSISILPGEIIDQVLAHLVGSQDALEACTLVCQRWRALAQPRLFHRIVLTTEELPKSIAFQRFLLDSPNIRSGIREITVHFPDLSSWPTDRKVAANLMGDILEVLPRPESLRLYGARYSDYRVKWTRLSAHLKNSIRTVLRRPSLSHLLIDGWLLDVNLPGFNVIFSNTTPSLTSLALLDISDSIWGTLEHVPEPPVRHHLDSLTVSNTFAKDFKLIQWLCHPNCIFDVRSLKTLRVEESRDDNSVSNLVSTIGASLERLEVNLSYTPEASIDLSPCVGLRSLSLTFGVPYTELYHSAFPWICETLCTVPRDNQIEELKLSLYITHPRNSQHDVFPPPQIGFFNYERWERLGHVLCTPRYAATLRQVTFQLIHHGIDVRGYSILAEQRLGKIGAKVTWRFMRDDSPEAD